MKTSESREQRGEDGGCRQPGRRTAITSKASLRVDAVAIQAPWLKDPEGEELTYLGSLRLEWNQLASLFLQHPSSSPYLLSQPPVHEFTTTMMLRYSMFAVLVATFAPIGILAAAVDQVPIRTMASWEWEDCGKLSACFPRFFSLSDACSYEQVCRRMQSMSRR